MVWTGYAEGRRKALAIGGLVSLCMGAVAFYAMEHSDVMAARYMYASNVDTPHGLVIEVLSGAAGQAPGMSTRADDVCQPDSGERGCVAWFSSLRSTWSASQREHLAQCVEESGHTLRVKYEMRGPHSHTHVMVIWCGGELWEVMLGYDPMAQGQPAGKRQWFIRGLREHPPA